MLLEFGFKNFFSFKEGCVISFKLDANCPEGISDGSDYAKVMCVKGANGSGKTQILKALAFLSYFVTTSFKSENNSTIPVEAFFESTDPTEFYVEFSVNDVVYLYELVCNKKKVISEKISRKINRISLLIERKDNSIFIKNKKLDALKSIKIKSNASMISTAHQYEFTELNDIYNFFNGFIYNVKHDGLNRENISINTISEILYNNKKVLDFVSDFISQCDIGISSVTVQEYTNPKGEKEYSPIFFHSHSDTEKPIFDDFESQGTKSLYLLLPMYAAKILSGGVIILDEFDLHLHPRILPKIIGLFTNNSINLGKAQIILSTHDTGILDLLSKYRTILVNKIQNESFAYRLDDIPGDIVRNDRSLITPYNLGKLGGVPNI